MNINKSVYYKLSTDKFNLKNKDNDINLKNTYLKYIKYKTKYKKLKENLIEKAINTICYIDTNMDNYIDTFFKTYNLITWTLNKLYSTQESNTELKEFCSSLNLTQLTNSCESEEAELQDKSVPYTNSLCCNFKGIIVSKRSIQKLKIGSQIQKDDIHFEFIKFFPRIETPDIKENAKKKFKSYLVSLVREAIPKLKGDKKLKVSFYEILESYDIMPDESEEYSNYLINETIEDDFVGLDEIIELIYPNEEHLEFDEYKRLKKIKDIESNGQNHSIQDHENKLFKQINLDGSNTYYFYFSFGTLNFIEHIDWEESLKIYVDEIRNLLSEQSIPVKSIILAGHSVGSIVVQHLAVQLLINRIDVSKIFIIGSGCRINDVLTDSQIDDIHLQFDNRYFFVISGYLRDEKIYYDHRSSDATNKVNKINTHFIICSNIKLDNSTDYICDPTTPTILKILDPVAVNRSGDFIPNPDSTLHDFSTYSMYYLKT